MNPSTSIALVFSCAFFMIGLFTGIWKYILATKSPDGATPLYVGISHRSSFHYSFAALLVAILAGSSPYQPLTTLVIVSTLLAFFTVTLIIYIVLGARGDRVGQFSRPLVFAGRELPEFARIIFMGVLIAAETIGFGLLFAGFLIRHL